MCGYTRYLLCFGSIRKNGRRTKNFLLFKKLISIAHTGRMWVIYKNVENSRSNRLENRNFEKVLSSEVYRFKRTWIFHISYYMRVCIKSPYVSCELYLFSRGQFRLIIWSTMNWILFFIHLDQYVVTWNKWVFNVYSAVNDYSFY